MEETVTEIVVRSIQGEAGVYLRQHMMEGCINIVDAAQEVPDAWDFLHFLLEKKHKEDN